jgi:hypothetical protein
LYISNSIVHLRRGVLSSNTVLGGSNYRSVGGPGQGGAIYNQGQLLLREVLLAGNRADGGGGYYEAAEGEGGALYTVNSTIIDACAFSDNTARGGDGGVRQVFPGPGGHGNGGAIYSAGMLRVTNSTVASNQAIGGNGAIGEFRAEPGGSANGGGIYSTAGTLTLTYATLARNSAIGGMGGMGGAWVPSGPNGAGSGGGVFNTNGTVTLVNTIIANSPSGSNCFGVVNDGGGNISSDGSCNFSALGSLNNTDPVLGPLGDYGGQTPTMPLLAGSPAIDRAISALCPRTDQRGVARPTGGGCDIGAFESGSVFSIRGRVSGWGLGPGLLVESTTSSTVTDANGNYMFDLLTAGTYAVLPFQPGWLFVPDLRVVTVGPDAPGMDFKGYRLNYLSPEPSSNAIYHYVFAGTNGDVHEIQVSTNLVNWQTIATNTVDANGIFEFFFTNNAFAERMRFLRTKKQP